MAELRSFIIGVTIAGTVLLVAGLAFGLFSDDSNGSPSVRLLGTPPATRTPAPGATRDLSQFTQVVPTATSSAPAGQTPGAETPAVTATESGIQTATATLETAPTAAATPEPTATPVVNNVLVYVENANQFTPGLVSQIEYLIGNVNGPNISSADWRNFTIQSAQSIQSLAGGLAGLSAPACLSGAHAGLVDAANQASGLASQVIAAVNSNNAAAATSTAGGLAAARDALNNGVTNISNLVANSC